MKIAITHFSSYTDAANALKSLIMEIDASNHCTLNTWNDICKNNKPHSKIGQLYGYMYAGHTKIKKDKKGFYVDLNSPVELTRKFDLRVYDDDSGEEEEMNNNEKKYDAVHNPSHYTEGRTFEPKDVIHDWDLSWNLGNAVKYISRAGRKGDAIEDLNKAIEYIKYEITELNKQ